MYYTSTYDFKRNERNVNWAAAASRLQLLDMLRHARNCCRTAWVVLAELNARLVHALSNVSRLRRERDRKHRIVDEHRVVHVIVELN